MNFEVLIWASTAKCNFGSVTGFDRSAAIFLYREIPCGSGRLLLDEDEDDEEEDDDDDDAEEELAMVMK